MRYLAAPAQTVGVVTPIPEWLTIPLPRTADACYELFCDVGRIPEWLTVVRSAVITRRDRNERPREVAFLARLERATVGYTLTYRYRHSERWVCWATPEESSISVSGFAQFSPLGARSCLMTYSLALDLGDGRLPSWSDPLYEGHAASAAMTDFRDFVTRAL